MLPLIRIAVLFVAPYLLILPVHAQTATPTFTDAQLTAFFDTLTPSSFSTLPAAVSGKVSVKAGEGLIVAFPAEGGLSFNAVLYTDDLYLQCEQITELESITNVIVACQAIKAGSTDVTITELQTNSEPKAQPWKKITVAIANNPTVSPAPTTPSPFQDVPSSHRHLDAITVLKDLGIIGGYSDGTFRPDITINRAEFTKIVFAATGEATGGSGCFTDVKNEWFAPYVCAAKQAGIIGGYPDGSFGPGKSINFSEAVKIVVLAFSDQTAADFQTSAGTAWYAPYLAYANDHYYLTLVDHLITTPGVAVTRGQVAQLIANRMP